MDRVSHIRRLCAPACRRGGAAGPALRACAGRRQGRRRGSRRRTAARPQSPNRPASSSSRPTTRRSTSSTPTFSAFPGAAETRAMPNTLDLIAKKGETFNRYYVSYPLCCPSRVSLLTGRYAHNTGVKGNVQPNGGYYGFSFRAAYSHNLATWLQGAGYRTIHIGKFLNGYGDEPYDNGTTVPPGWNDWHTVLNADTHHYFYGYTLNNNGELSEPLRRLGQLGNARIRRSATTPAALSRRSKGGPATTRPTSSTGSRREEMLATPRRTALLPTGRLHRPTRRLPPPRRARAGAAPLRLVQGRQAAAQPLRRLRRGQRQRQAALHPRSGSPDPEREADLQGLLREAARVAALGRRRRQRDRRHARPAAPAAQHLHPLHLRQRLLLRRAPADRRQVPRLRAGHPPALPDPRAGHRAGQLDRRAGGEHRHRPDDPRAGGRRSRTRASTAARWSPSCATPNCAPAGRSSSSPSSQTSDVEANGAISASGEGDGGPPAATAAPAPASRRRPSPRAAAAPKPRFWRRR